MPNSVKLGVVMDPIQNINPLKDTTLALLIEAQRQGCDLYYLEPQQLFLRYGTAWGEAKRLQVADTSSNWFSLGDPVTQPLDQLDIILMRANPPVTLNYFYSTYILEIAEQQGSLVVNSPQGLRDANEKLLATWFPQCMPPAIVTSHLTHIRDFIEEHETAVLKPLDNMGGRDIFKCVLGDPNLNSIVDYLTQQGNRPIMVQRFIPEIEQGDKRILLINGEPLPYALNRFPSSQDFRANLAAGGKGAGAELTTRDRWICNEIAPVLQEKGLTFVGIDVIGDYLTEINVTSPTCLREIERAFNVELASHVIEAIMEQIEGSE